MNQQIGGGREDAAEAVARHLSRLLEEWSEGGQETSAERLRRSILEAGWREMAKRRELDWRGWGEGGDGDCDPFVASRVAEWPEEIWADPHGLGWIHEQFAARARHASFAGHVQREEKHQNATVSTQLYTPRWIADALADETFRLAESDEPAVLDPAVGGGQMLLAALERLAEAAPDGLAERWAQKLWGLDLDRQVVDVARRTLALEIGRIKGQRSPEAEAVLKEQIFAADGLTCDRGGPWQVVLTNPPYMGWRSMPGELREALDPRFRPYHSDLFSAFIARCHELAEQAVGILAQQSIWYLRRFEKARRHLMSGGEISLFLHLGAGAFWNLDGEKASVVAFAQRSKESAQDCGQTDVWDLRTLRTPGEKQRAFIAGDRRYLSHFDAQSTAAIPGRPFCHDLSPELRALFATMPALQELADVPGGQNKTGKNKRFVRAWADVPAEALRFVEALGGRGDEAGRWVFYSKGGRFAPWWGNWDWVVDWSDEARRFYDSNRTSNLLDQRYWFRQGIVYTDFGGKRFNARWMPPGCVFDMTGPAIFPEEHWWPGLDEKTRIGAALAILNSSPARRMLRALNPTLHFQVRNLRALPVPELGEEEAAALAKDVWAIVDGVRWLHGLVEGDPLEGSQAEVGEPAALLERLVRLEADVDLRVCEAYGVAREPIDSARVCDHHRLAKILR